MPVAQPQSYASIIRTPPPSRLAVSDHVSSCTTRRHTISGLTIASVSSNNSRQALASLPIKDWPWRDIDAEFARYLAENNSYDEDTEIVNTGDQANVHSDSLFSSADQSDNSLCITLMTSDILVYHPPNSYSSDVENEFRILGYASTPRQPQNSTLAQSQPDMSSSNIAG